MSLETRRLWLHHIKIAQEALKKQKEQREKHQGTLSSFLNVFSENLPQPRRRQRVAQDDAEEHAEGVVLYRVHGQQRIDSIFNRLE